MKLVHLSDLHIGKRVNGFSMLEDQKDILTKIIRVIDDELPDAVLIAGDVYDRGIPSEEAVELFDDFLVRLARRKLQVYIISGNHDSAERVAFGGRLMGASGIHLAPVYGGRIEPLTLRDPWGEVDLWLIPFLKPAHVRRFFPEAEIDSYTDAMHTVIANLNMDPCRRQVALVHQFIVGGQVSESEEKQTVGGTEAIEAEVFAPFDYVALGHLHGPQRIHRDEIRYAGSPLKYSFSEANQKKSVTVVELREKGTNSVIRQIPLTPLRDMIRIRGCFEEVMAVEHRSNDYYEITLTDEEDVPNALVKLREKYPNMMIMRYDNMRTRSNRAVSVTGDVETKSDLELFDELFQLQYAREMSEEQKEYVQSLIDAIGGESL